LSATSIVPLLVLSVPVAVTVQLAGLLEAMVTSSDTGVIEVEPPEVFSVSQVAVQATVAFCCAPDSIVMVTVISAGVLIFSVTVQVAFTVDVLDALQKPAVLALATVTPMVIAPAASNPVKAV
jgi:hypothetical protein